MNDRLARLKPWFYEEVYRNDIADLEIDTARHGVDDVCALIEARLAEGPGTACAELARKWLYSRETIESAGQIGSNCRSPTAEAVLRALASREGARSPVGDRL